MTFEDDSVAQTSNFSTTIIVDLKIEWNKDLADRESKAFEKEKSQILKAFEIVGRQGNGKN